MPKKMRTTAQNSMMFALAAKAGVTHEDLREWVFDLTGGRTEHTSELYHDEAIKIIDRLDAIANPHKEKQKWSPRTVQRRRHEAGVPQIVTVEHLAKMNALWFKVEGRTKSELESLCIRSIKVEKPRTTKECNSIIEAIKAMNIRENALNPFKDTKKEKGAA